MATSGSKSVTVTAHDTLKFSWSQSSQSITNNTTTISWKLQLITDAYGRISSTASKSWSVTVNGKKYSGTNTVGIGNSSTKTLASGTTTIAHNSDGTKTFSYSFSQQFAITFSGTHIGTKSGSGTGTLNTIPRASSFGTITGNTIGSGITININRNSTSFTHTLWYSFGSLTWQGIGSSIGTSATFTPPLSICSQVPSSTSGAMTLILRTYNGTTQIGSDVYKTITVYVPSSVAPNISGVTISEANTSVVPSSWGVYVQNKTKLKFVTSATAGTGSSIASVTVSINGKSYSGTTATTDIITASGNLTATITAKDLRGRSASTTKTVTIQAYSNPYISNFTIIRCDSSGKASEAGSYAKVTFVGGRSSVSSKNTGSYSFQYKKSTASSYTTYNFSVTSSTINTSVILSGIDTNYSYSFIGISKDYFTSIKTAAKTLSSAFVTVDYLNGGHGIAFGKVAETTNLFDVNFNVLLRKGFKKYGDDTITTTTNDTTSNWGAFNNSIHFYTKTGQLLNQPSQYGYLLNIGEGSEVHQIWMTQASGNMAHRGGNGSGWNGSWRTILDSSNYSSYALPLTGGNVSGTANVSGVSAFNWVRFNNSWVGFYGSHANAINGTSRLGWIGHNATTHLNITNEAGGNIILKSTGAQIDLTCKSCTVTLDYSDGSTYNGYFIPATTAKTTLGTTSYRWYGLYSNQACNTSSDARLKSNIIPMNSELATFLSGNNSNIFENIFFLLNPVAFSLNIEDSTEHEGRMHFGFIAQEVEKALEENGLDEKATSFVTHSFWTDEETGEEKDEYSLRYEEFIALNTHMIQKQQKEIDTLKSENTALRKELDELKELVNKLAKSA